MSVLIFLRSQDFKNLSVNVKTLRVRMELKIIFILEQFCNTIGLP